MRNQRQPLLWFPLWFFFGSCLAGIVIYLSLTSKPLPSTDIVFSDKFGHFLAYFALVFWFAQLYLQKHHGLLVLLFVLMGALLEVAQSQTSYRTFQYADMLANTVGAALGWLLAKTRCSELLLQTEQRLLRR